MSKKHSLHGNLLIVCEGSVTEPDCFAILKKKSLKNDIWKAITITPKPPIELREEESPPSPHKSTRPKRQLKNVPLEDEADEIETLYEWRKTPVKFVKEARDGLKDGVFDEVWAVFDRNGHPAHEQAFALSREPIDGKIVNIAFSSVAFEHWILLHFERNDTTFVKSECKNDKGRYLDCGTGDNKNDCWGRLCIAGYLRTNGYMNGSTKKSSEDFQLFFEKLLEFDRRYQAYENAAWLRHTVSHDLNRPYLANPFTNVDALVKRLLGDEGEVIEWANLGELKEWQSLSILIDFQENILECTIINNNIGARLFNGSDIAAILHKNGEKYKCPSMPNTEVIIPAKESRKFKFSDVTKIEYSTFELTTLGYRLLIEL